MVKIKILYRKCKQSGASFIYLVLYWIYAKLRKKEILIHHKTILNGFRNINPKGRLWIGMDNTGFVLSKIKRF